MMEWMSRQPGDDGSELRWILLFTSTTSSREYNFYLSHFLSLRDWNHHEYDVESVSVGSRIWRHPTFRTTTDDVLPLY